MFNMRLLSLVLFASAVSFIHAEDIPWADLQEKGVGTNALGTFSVEFFGQRSKSPNFFKKFDRPTPENGRFQDAGAKTKFGFARFG